MNCEKCKMQARRIIELEEQVGDLQDKLLRCLAKEENTRRRVIDALKSKS